MKQQIGWGLIGCGDISRKRVAPALRDMPEADFVAVSRAQPALAAAFASEFGARKSYVHWQELIRDPEIDAVYLATPVHLHSEQTIAAAEAGRHVLCEKPMALNAVDCDRMIAACRANNVKLGIAYYRHFYPVIARIREILASNELGIPILAQINAFERFNPAPGQPRHWFVNKAQAGGGPMMDFGCHRIEVLLDLLGPIVNVKPDVSSILFDREVEDTAIAVFQFASCVRAVLSVTHAAMESQDTLDLFCSEGSIHVPVLNRGELQIRTAQSERLESHPPHANIHQPLIEDFTLALVAGANPVVDGTIGREVARIEEMIYAGG
jgi:predicted dehydrogenase